jgi:hypothetical protein
LPTVDYKVVITDTNFAGGGTSIVMQQPTPGNSYVAGVNTGDPVGTYSDNNVHYFILNLQQITPISIKWGDWSPIPIAPKVLSITPNTGTTAGGKSVTIGGTGFTNATSATIGGTNISSFVVVNDTTITGITPAGSQGTSAVAVTGPNGTDSANGLFIYVNPIAVPFITSVTPNTGTTVGSQLITIGGTGFTNATGATIGGSTIGSFTVVNDTTITGVTPTGSLGSAAVAVTGPGGTSNINGLFTYI